MICPKIAQSPDYVESCTVFRSRWRSRRQPKSQGNWLPSLLRPPSLSSPRHMQGRRWKMSRPNLLFFCGLRAHIQNLFFVRPGWCRRLSWLAYPTPFCTSLSSTGLWWRIRRIRRRWWRTSSRKVPWLTPTCICPQPRTGNCRRWP